MFTPGPSRNTAPRDRASRPNSRPRRSANSGSHVAANPMPAAYATVGAGMCAPYRSIGHLEVGDAQSSDGVSAKRGIAADEVNLLIRRHPFEQVVHPRFQGRTIWNGSLRKCSHYWNPQRADKTKKDQDSAVPGFHQKWPHSGFAVRHPRT
jgi:hypothetical protein